MSKELYFNCYLDRVIVFDVSDFWFVVKVKPDIFIVKEEVVFWVKICSKNHGQTLDYFVKLQVV